MNIFRVLSIIILLFLDTTFASTVTTVGAGREYATISEALDALTPLSEDLTIYVTVPSSGITEPMDISYEMTRGHSLEIRGERVAATETVYYFDDGVEFRLDEFMNTKTIEYIGEGLGRKITHSGRSSSGNQYYIKNHLGSTMMVTNDDASLVLEVNDYLPYGKKINELESADDETYTFTGKELDKYDRDLDDNEDGEGLYYFGARYYDADIGLWTSLDPEKQFWSGYSYMGNFVNPITNFDPNGRKVPLLDTDPSELTGETFFSVTTDMKLGTELSEFPQNPNPNFHHSWAEKAAFICVSQRDPEVAEFIHNSERNFSAVQVLSAMGRKVDEVSLNGFVTFTYSNSPLGVGNNTFTLPPPNLKEYIKAWLASPIPNTSKYPGGTRIKLNSEQQESLNGSLDYIRYRKFQKNRQ